VPYQGITIADPNLPDCPIVYVNDAFCKITGYARDETIGRNCRFLQGADTDMAAVDRLRTAIREVRLAMKWCFGACELHVSMTGSGLCFAAGGGSSGNDSGSLTAACALLRALPEC